MAVPTCTETPDPPEPAEQDMPGGAKMSSMPNPASGIISEFDNMSQMLQQLSPALAGIQPVLKAIDAVVSIFTTLQKAPEIPDDPTGFVESLEETGKKIGELSNLVPQVSVFSTVRSSLQNVLKFAKALKEKLQPIVDAVNEAEDLLQQAIDNDDPELASVAQCSLDQQDQLVAHTGVMFQPMTTILDLIESLLGFVPQSVDLPEIPDVTGKSGEEMIEILDEIIDALESIPFI